MSVPYDDAERRDDVPGNDLSPEDRRLLDAMAADGFDPAQLDALRADDQPRGRRLVDLMQLLNDYPVEDANDLLVPATLARIDRHEDESNRRLLLDATHGDGGGGRRRFWVPDFISVAAVLLIAASVLWPVLSNIRHRSIDLRCADNLRELGYGFSAYAADNGSALPVAKAGANLSWDTVANVINLRPLLQGHYCDAHHLNCPGVHDSGTDASYSYQWQQPGASVSWGAQPSRVLVLGDRNPLIDAFHDSRPIGARSISLNHGGRGQNVLGNDGATLWLEDPVIGREDNIWLPRGSETLAPGARPKSADDVFLVH